MANDLSQRAQNILSAVIAQYILTAEPVSSRSVSNHQGIDVSSATIRNVMAELEDKGLLSQPHVSAGRVPTPKGLRFYVDAILELRKLDPVIKDQLDVTLDKSRHQDTGDVIKVTSKVLSIISQQVAVVSLPSPEREVFRHMEFVLLHPGLILVVMVSKAGLVQNRVIEAEPDILQEDLDKFTKYLNELLADLSLWEVKDRVAREMKREKARFDNLASKALSLGHKALEKPAQSELVIQGRSNLMEAPEFMDVAKLRQIFQAFEEKSILLRLLEKSLSAHGVQIFIGAESSQAGLDGLTAVTSAYGREKPLGAVGVIGPTRMDYSRVIPMVDYTARLVSKILENRS